jgi:hypothetical protein
MWLPAVTLIPRGPLVLMMTGAGRLDNDAIANCLRLTRNCYLLVLL